MSAAKKNAVPPEKLEQFEKLVATIPGIERKGAGVPYTSLNGNMFSYLQPGGSLALRLPTAEREKFLAKYDAGLVKAYGVVQKEYVDVPEALLKTTAQLKPWFEISWEYAKSLRPKATKKKSG